jgi:uncharacterized membrane protein
MNMTTLIIGLVVFLGVHSISIVSWSWRDRYVARIGRPLWQAGYAAVALVGLVLVVRGYGIARQVPVFLYAPPSWLRDAATLLLVFVFPLLLAAYLPGRIRTRLKHPMLVATKIWAIAHLLANGTLADVLLFGSFLVWAGATRASLKYRPVRPVPSLPASPWNDVIAVGLGVGIYLAFIAGLHAVLIGVPVILPQI